MTTKELIELLGRCDPASQVVFTTQKKWPLEYQIEGLVTREDCRDEWGLIRTDGGRTPTDVILVEGQQLGYGEPAAWDAMERSRRRY